MRGGRGGGGGGKGEGERAAAAPADRACPRRAAAARPQRPIAAGRSSARARARGGAGGGRPAGGGVCRRPPPPRIERALAPARCGRRAPRAAGRPAQRCKRPALRRMARSAAARGTRTQRSARSFPATAAHARVADGCAAGGSSEARARRGVERVGVRVGGTGARACVSVPGRALACDPLSFACFRVLPAAALPRGGALFAMARSPQVQRIRKMRPPAGSPGPGATPRREEGPWPLRRRAAAGAAQTGV